MTTNERPTVSLDTVYETVSSRDHMRAAKERTHPTTNVALTKTNIPSHTIHLERSQFCRRRPFDSAARRSLEFTEQVSCRRIRHATAANFSRILVTFECE